MSGEYIERHSDGAVRSSQRKPFWINFVQARFHTAWTQNGHASPA